MKETLRIRAAGAGDHVFLERMLYEAAMWDSEPGARPPIDEVLARPRTALYVAGWGRPGDAGVVGDMAGEPVGAAWYRFYDRTACGYGFVDESVPELTIGVEAAWRGRGIGRALLEELLDVARAASVAAVSLSVEEGNPALRLYERCGFRRLEFLDGAWTMIADLSGGAASDMTDMTDMSDVSDGPWEGVPSARDDSGGRSGPGSPSA